MRGRASTLRLSSRGRASGWAGTSTRVASRCLMPFPWGRATRYSNASCVRSSPTTRRREVMDLNLSEEEREVGGEADNILYFANDEQKEKYLIPTISGERKSCFAITETGAGSDARAIRT